MPPARAVPGRYREPRGRRSLHSSCSPGDSESVQCQCHRDGHGGPPRRRPGRARGSARGLGDGPASPSPTPRRPRRRGVGLGVVDRPPAWPALARPHCTVRISGRGGRSHVKCQTVTVTVTESRSRWSSRAVSAIVAAAAARPV